MTLAKKHKDEKVLILTLNRSLAGLISELVDCAAHPEGRSNIEVLPFFKLCQRLLHEFEPQNDRLYDDITWKTLEHIDEIWLEYYRCELNNYDAKVLQRVHDSLISRKIDAETYIREEFDWIRSAVPAERRNEYLSIPRTRRAYPLDESFRRLLLDGLQLWEKKMKDIGITDYLGLSSSLYKHLDRIKPMYRCILVDESQDFGTVELEIIRALVNKSDNDLFLCGDAAQQVSSKHQELKKARIDVPSSRSRKLTKNYRNSREILRVAYEVLASNVSDDMLNNNEFEILDPKHGYFHGPSPLLLRAQNISEELGMAVRFLSNEISLEPNTKACLVICGYSLLEVQAFGKEHNLLVLDGSLDISDGQLFVSDLENTKGFEFQHVCIVNCDESTVPHPNSPNDEQFRDLARLYVAMTRARTQLVLSYSSSISPFLSPSRAQFLEDEWVEYLDVEDPESIALPPPVKSSVKHNAEYGRSFRDLTADHFLFSEHAIGLDGSFIEKLRKTVTGRSRIVEGQNVEWRNFGQLASDIRTQPSARRLFGKDVGTLRAMLKHWGVEK